MPMACSSWVRVSPEAPLAVMPKAYSTDTGESSTPSDSAVCRSRAAAKSMTAVLSSVRSVWVSMVRAVMPSVRLWAFSLPPQPNSGSAIQTASASAAIRFPMGSAPFHVLYPLDGAEWEKVSLRAK